LLLSLLLLLLLLLLHFFDAEWLIILNDDHIMRKSNTQYSGPRGEMLGPRVDPTRPNEANHINIPEKDTPSL
jgi:hypothetical protein